MNLNISVQFTNNCLGNNVSNESVTKGEGFTNVLEKLGSLDKEVDLNEILGNEEEEIEGSIDHNYILNILNNISNINNMKELKSLDNTKVIDSLKGIQGLDNSELEKILSLIKSNDELNHNQSLVMENLNKVDLNKDDIMLLNLIKESLKNKSESNKQDMNLNSSIGDKNKLDNTLLEKISEMLNQGTTSKNEIQTIGDKNNIVNESTKNLNVQKSYEELENSALINKNNIINNNSSESMDKDISALEQILDNKDKNNFMYPSNVNNNISTATNKEDNNQIIARNINQDFLAEDVVTNIKYLKENGLEEIKIKLTPKELGDMTIKLVKTLEETKVHIIISKDDVFDLVNKNLGDISKHLKELNINVKEVSVDVQTNNEKFFSDNLNQEFNKKNQQNKKQRNILDTGEVESVEETKTNSSVDNNLNILI